MYLQFVFVRSEDWRQGHTGQTIFGQSQRQRSAQEVFAFKSFILGSKSLNKLGFFLGLLISSSVYVYLTCMYVYAYHACVSGARRSEALIGSPQTSYEWL